MIVAYAATSRFMLARVAVQVAHGRIPSPGYPTPVYYAHIAALREVGPLPASRVQRSNGMEQRCRNHDTPSLTMAPCARTFPRGLAEWLPQEACLRRRASRTNTNAAERSPGSPAPTLGPG